MNHHLTPYWLKRSSQEEDPMNFLIYFSQPFTSSRCMLRHTDKMIYIAVVVKYCHGWFVCRLLECTWEYLVKEAGLDGGKWTVTSLNQCMGWPFIVLVNWDRGSAFCSTGYGRSLVELGEGWSWIPWGSSMSWGQFPEEGVVAILHDSWGSQCLSSEGESCDIPQSPKMTSDMEFREDYWVSEIQ